MEDKINDFKYENKWNDMSNFSRCEFVWDMLMDVLPKFKEGSVELVEELTLLKELEKSVRGDYDSYICCKKECIQGILNKMIDTLEK